MIFVGLRHILPIPISSLDVTFASWHKTARSTDSADLAPANVITGCLEFDCNFLCEHTSASERFASGTPRVVLPVERIGQLSRVLGLHGTSSRTSSPFNLKEYNLSSLWSLSDLSLIHYCEVAEDFGILLTLVKSCRASRGGVVLFKI